MARRVASEIVERRLELYGGACRIWLSYGSVSPELEKWSDLVINYEVAAETGGTERANQELFQAARLLLAQPE